MKRTKRELLGDICNAAYAAVNPYQAVKRVLKRENNLLGAGTGYDLDAFDRVVVVGAGKAAAHMAAAVEEALDDVLSCGSINVKYGHTAALRIIEQVEAAHPIPDEAGIYGTRKILDLLAGVDAKTLVLCLLSGGASALLVDPLPGISLVEKQKTTDLLIRSGASVYDLNTVLKHLSGVKGGRLARAAYPGTVLTLTLSDVIGDRIDVIGSGPTAPGNATFCEALQVIGKFNLRYKLPESVVDFIVRGAGGREPETADSSEPCFRKTKNVIVGGIVQALFSSGQKAKESGYAPEIMINETSDPVYQTARTMAKTALRMRDNLAAGEKRCLLWASERASLPAWCDTASRNREIALAFAQETAGIPGITFLSAAIGGRAAGTEASHVIVDGTTTWSARKSPEQTECCAEKNDPSGFLNGVEPFQNDVTILPEGTNLMEMQIMLVE